MSVAAGGQRDMRDVVQKVWFGFEATIYSRKLASASWSYSCFSKFIAVAWNPYPLNNSCVGTPAGSTPPWDVSLQHHLILQHFGWTEPSFLHQLAEGCL